MKKVINSFDKGYFFLSNFFEHQNSPIFMEHSNIPFYSVEAAFQCAKYHGPHVRDIQRIFSMLSPEQAKHLGRALSLSPDWEFRKFDIMYDLVEQKFTRSEHLKEKLLETGDAELIEGNTWHDTCWGFCTCEKHKCGNNHLGVILMKVREKLKSIQNA